MSRPTEDTMTVRQMFRRGLQVSPEFRAGLVVTLILAAFAAGGRAAVPFLTQRVTDEGLLAEGGVDVDVVLAYASAGNDTGAASPGAQAPAPRSAPGSPTATKVASAARVTVTRTALTVAERRTPRSTSIVIAKAATTAPGTRSAAGRLSVSVR